MGTCLPSLRPKVWVGAGLGLGLGLREGLVQHTMAIPDFLIWESTPQPPPPKPTLVPTLPSSWGETEALPRNSCSLQTLGTGRSLRPLLSPSSTSCWQPHAIWNNTLRTKRTIWGKGSPFWHRHSHPTNASNINPLHSSCSKHSLPTGSPLRFWGKHRARKSWGEL